MVLDIETKADEFLSDAESVKTDIDYDWVNPVGQPYPYNSGESNHLMKPIFLQSVKSYDLDYTLRVLLETQRN